jgi:hypothetical protein
MKNLILITLLISASSVLALSKQRPGANNGNSAAAPGEGTQTTDIQEEEDLTIGTRAERDQQRRNRESERDLERLRKEEHIRRNQRSGINNGFVP